MDSNAVVDYLGRKFTFLGMEFMSEAVIHMRLLADFMNDSVVAELTEEVAQTAIQIRRIHKIKLPNAIIAAATLTSRSTLLTRNVSDFKNIEGLDYINPHTL